MGIWFEKYEMWKNNVRLDEISPARQLFFKTTPTENQILYLDMVQARNNAAWAVMLGMTFMLGLMLGAIAWWKFSTMGCL